MFTSGPVALEETWKTIMKTEMAGIERTSWRLSGSSRVPVNVVRLQDLRGETRGKRHFRSRVNCFSGCRKVLSTEWTTQEVSLSIRGAKCGRREPRPASALYRGCLKEVYGPLQRLSKM